MPALEQNQRSTLILCLLTIFLFSTHATAQPDENITNEYRATLVTSKPVSDKVILFQYLGYVNSPDKRCRRFTIRHPA